jgi:N-acylneuraminate cytidylyltransferase
MACSPLVEEGDLQEAAKFYECSCPAKTVIAVSEYQAPIEWAFERSEEGALSPVNPGMFSIRSQDIKKKYHDAGVFAIFDSKQIIGSEGAGSDLDFMGYVLPRYKAIDIDNEEDWLFAEKIFKSKVSGI